MDTKILRMITLCLSIVALFTAIGAPALAAKPAPLQLYIQAAVVDFSNKIIYIHGSNFANGITPNVSLGNYYPSVQSYTDLEIQVELPAGISSGTYLLRVATGPSSTQIGTFYLTIAPAGPGIDKTKIYYKWCTSPDHLPSEYCTCDLTTDIALTGGAWCDNYTMLFISGPIPPEQLNGFDGWKAKCLQPLTNEQRNPQFMWLKCLQK